MIKKYKSIICILLLPLLLSGCWDYKDIEKRSISLAVGVDEVKDNIEFTGEIARFKSVQLKQEENVETRSAYQYIANGKNFEETRKKYDALIPFENFTGANRVFVFSQNYAEGGIKTYINRLSSVQELRDASLIAISKESTKEFFSGSVENDFSIGYAVEDTIRYLSKIGGTLYKTGQEIKSDIDFESIGYFVPYITKDKDVVEYLGLAAMKDSKLVGIVKREDSGGFLFMLADKPSSTMLITHPSNEKNFLSIKSDITKRKIKTSYDNGIKIYIDLKVESQLAYLYKVEAISEEELRKVEENISQKIKKQVIYALERSKNEFKCDVFGFGRYFKAQNLQKYRKIKWEDEYLNAEFYVNVNTKMKNTNLIDTNAKKKD